MFDQIRQILSGDQKQVPVIEKLKPDEVSDLNLSWNSRFNVPALKKHLEHFPDFSYRVNGLDEYIIGDHWRKHEKIGHIIESRARLYRKELVFNLVDDLKTRGFGAVIIGNDEYGDNSRFYSENGFIEIERIVYYEKLDMNIPEYLPDYPLALFPYTPSRLNDLLEVDHQSFPWLWNNSREEMSYYSIQEGVHINLCYDLQSHEPVGYFSFTLYERWAHLDRLAVIPNRQGVGVGAFQLSYALNQMKNLGAKRVSLSTQMNNQNSQRLYERNGFHRVRSLEYSLMGQWLG